MSEKIEILFNEKPLQVEKGGRLIEVCAQQSVEIPRFCYHPGLSVVGSCRMCQVEIEGPGPAPRRLAISCRTDCVPGLKVWTDTKPAHEARRGVLEFLLKNHPLDCPICDKAGECPLQNYTYAEGQAASRSEDPKRHFRKRVDLGPVIVLDEERCVLCSRCVRFTDEVAKDPQLFVRGRGPDAMVGTFEDEPLRGNYQGNLADICPVGALTLKKFRFQARVWNLKSAESVCPGCSRGCNVTVDVHRGKVVRIRPRYNEEVNGHWICDIGRFGFDELNRSDRLKAVLIWEGEGYADRGWEEGLAAAASRLSAAGSKTLAVASPYLTNEEGERFAALCEALGTKPHLLVPEPRQPDHLLYTGEIGPNQRGLADLGFEKLRAADLAAKLHGAPLVYLAGEKVWDLLGAAGQEALDSCESAMLQEVFQPETPGVDVFLPAASWAEKWGHFTNRDGRKQPIRAALPLPSGVRPDRETFEELRRRVEEGIEIGVEVEEGE